MKRYATLLLLPVLLLAACQSEPADSSEEALAAPAAYDTFGETFDADGALPIATVAAEPETYAGQVVKIEGTVTEVCQMAGCWLTMQVPNGENIRIVVPRDEEGNYVFTVAKDLSGRRAVVQGILATEVLDEHTQHHYAEDAGHEADHEMHAGTEDAGHEAHDTEAAPKPELQLTASGVLVEKAST